MKQKRSDHGEVLREVTVEEAQVRLSDLIEAALRGEGIAITTEDRKVVQLVPLSPRPRRQFGSARGKIVMTEDFDAPVADFDEYTR